MFLVVNSPAIPPIPTNTPQYPSQDSTNTPLQRCVACPRIFKVIYQYTPIPITISHQYPCARMCRVPKDSYGLVTNTHQYPSHQYSHPSQYHTNTSVPGCV